MEWTDRIGRRVKLRDLHIFLAVAQSGSMAKAANHLAISQPVVSKTISDLEHALGVRVLDRTFQGVEPTAYGRALINCGIAVFDEMRRGVQKIEYLADPTVGELRVGSPTPLADGLIPAVLDKFTSRYPRIACHAAEGDTPTMCRLLRDRDVDLVISRTWGSHFGEDFATEFLFDESLFAVAGLDSPWLCRHTIDFADLLDEPWVLPELDNVVGALISDGFRRAGIALPTPRVVSNSMAIRTRLVESGRFLTMLPGSMLHFGAERLRVKALPVRLPLESQPVEVITLRDRTPNPIGRLFVDELRALILPSMKPNRGSNSRMNPGGKLNSRSQSK
jgi:DNA-binding transcriptional LysR family regulator